MNYEQTSIFQFNHEAGAWQGNFKGDLGLIVESSSNYGEKPMFLAPMASREQLQPVLDNPHLFDPAFVNAVRVLANLYDQAAVNYSDD